MPVVTIQMLAGRTHSQKAELARVVTEAVSSIAHTNPDGVIVVFQEVTREDYAIGGTLMADQQTH
jgi:4-oxalocrotonate tautomerase